ncbi:hypothetical protein [uncultured Vagococcus sp.]|uniref:hypothetical protein n=1 Tax=uncultured Vagococcus sp. TaxID=189676 RepID=UPI0028D3BF7C|nr:hypothetical protein [uncultured Vagococcus sp.]
MTYVAKEVIDDFERTRAESKNTHTAYRGVKPIYAVSILEYNHFDDSNPLYDFTFKDKHSDMRYTDIDGKELQRHVFLELKKFDNNANIEKSVKNWFQFWANVTIDSNADKVILEADEQVLDESKWSKEAKEMLAERVRSEKKS